jgi:hypothetical protein
VLLLQQHHQRTTLPKSDAYTLLLAALPQTRVQQLQWYCCSGSESTAQPMLVLL